MLAGVLGVGWLGWGVSWGGWGGVVGVGWLHCFLGRAICNKLCAWNAQVHSRLFIYIYI